MHWFRIFLILSILNVSSATAQETASPEPVIVILEQSGDIKYARLGWTVAQSLQRGAILHGQDFIYPDQASLTVLCPDGTVKNFAASQLFPNDIIHCTDGQTVIGSPGEQRLNIQRGGGQHPTVPYLISPRNSLVRTSDDIAFTWNALLNVQTYTLIIRQDSMVIKESTLIASDVTTDDGLATYVMSLPLIEGQSYAVEICVLFEDFSEACTTEAGWNTGTDTAFYYVPSPATDLVEQQISTDLADNIPAALYARAVLLSHAIVVISDGKSIGYYNEAIDLLQVLIQQYQASPFATSPETYALLGDLYVGVGLLTSAWDAYQQAFTLAQPGTEIYARVALGVAITSTDQDEALSHYNLALDQYMIFLNENAFLNKLQNVCQSAGDLCLKLERCQTQQEQCQQWREAVRS